jgi:hypothetical protein
VTVNGEDAVLPDGGVTGPGREKVTPEGADPTHEGESATAALKPLSDVMVMLESPLDPCITEMLIVDELIEKSGVAGTPYVLNQLSPEVGVPEMIA